MIQMLMVGLIPMSRRICYQGLADHFAKSLLRLKARGFHHPRRGHQERKRELNELEGFKSISFPMKAASFSFPIHLPFLKDRTDQ